MNFFEMLWGACESFTKSNCSYYFKDLQYVTSLSLQNVELSTIRTFSRKCYRYMDAYRLRDDKGNSVTSQQIEFELKNISVTAKLF